MAFIDIFDLTLIVGVTETFLQCVDVNNTQPTEDLYCYIRNQTPIKVSSGDT
jgi:hypothetical protein